ncbi:FMN-binding negative transcriptional regulator [Nocardia sp. 348MFTsu5.1]|uniref:FMN-binding negative transcriptional regulator n=1 Tax=Nocardia sp. 348MFTsu5.1 TaxID=1172185 RepID=UPI00037ADE58|nr:FMN-binding negative transcriptional regulator [Nocardia sp. 348MFTsu5.1]
MYIPRKFELTDEQIATALRSSGMAHLITSSADGFQITPMPMMFDPDRNTLVAHMARANPHWHAADAASDSVAIFAGLDGYISPSLYATKAEGGKVVPTWNYETINVYGSLQVHDDPDWLLEHVSVLSDRHEHARDMPWAVADAPEHFIAGQLKAIVGIELVITRWEGKAKMSQNQPERNQISVVDGLSNSSNASERALAGAVITYTGPPAV